MFKIIGKINPYLNMAVLGLGLVQFGLAAIRKHQTKAYRTSVKLDQIAGTLLTQAKGAKELADRLEAALGN